MRRPYRKLNLDERRILATMLQAKATKTKIAEVLGRDRSTIYREIKRNRWHDEEVPQADGYWHVTAQTLADGRHLKRRKLEQHEDLRNEVIGKLITGWSPEQIAGRLRIELDLSRFSSGLFRAIFAMKETQIGTKIQRRVQT
ncbi:helix-turn-helix domain-containing protein [Puniceibacterium sp. IMCC21224]|uniref:helix-turn-helix domain-containing protein n=1 Tax=Puniceibacterium sp. IMCC21224 TaxID=1618204 RepID=UPI00064D8494|nr:helix-turn-helix domain-containing protein [Puniceibacterium sp. IMCC21224]KMK67164.1 Helix-turn-helix domain [Puniceibacterium sp. IMCC21224]